MAPNTIFMAVPLGTATNYKWQGLFRDLGEPGYKVFWAAAALADMAAEGGRGGRLLDGQGEPLTALQICTRLGVEATWAEKIMFPALIFLGEGHWGDEGGWNCTSPMISKTLEWQQGSRTKALPEPERGPGRPATGHAKTQAERAREYRARKKNETSRVTEPVTASQNRHENHHENRHGNYRDASTEDAEIVGEKDRHENPLKEVKSKVIKKQQQGSVTGAAAASPAADPQNLLPGEVEALLAGLHPGCRAVLQKFETLPEPALLAALQKVKRRGSNITDPPAYLFSLLSSSDAVAATPELSGPRETAKDRALCFFNSLSPGKQEELIQLGQNTQGGSRDPIYTGWCAMQADPEIAALFAI